MKQTKKVTSRQELRRQLKQVTSERDQLVERLMATNQELKLHALWCGYGLKKPNKLKAGLWALLTRLTRQTNA